MSKVNLLVSIGICALFVYVSMRGGEIFTLGASSGGTRGGVTSARIYHK